MTTTKPSMSYEVFKRACIGAISSVNSSLTPQRRMLVDDQGIRILRSNMLLTAQTCKTLTLTIEVMVEEVVERTSCLRVRYADIEAFLATRTYDDDGETEWVHEGFKSSATWQMLKILERIPHKSKPDVSLSTGLLLSSLGRSCLSAIGTFNREQLALVGRTYIEREALEV